MPTTLNNINIGAKVKISIDNVLYDFIVVHKGLPSSLYDESCNGVWLMMDKIIDTYNWKNESIAAMDYFDGRINGYLEQVLFPSKFNYGTKSRTRTAKLPYVDVETVDGVRNVTIKTGADGYPSPLFSLSFAELGFENDASPTDGAVLDYFKNLPVWDDSSLRVAYYNDTATIWSSRSVYFNPTSTSSRNGTRVLAVTTTGGPAAADFTYSFGVRPALIMPAQTPVLDDNTIGVYQTRVYNGTELAGTVMSCQPVTTIQTTTDRAISGNSCTFTFSYAGIPQQTVVVNNLDFDTLLGFSYTQDSQTIDVPLDGIAYRDADRPFSLYAVYAGDNTYRVLSNDGLKVLGIIENAPPIRSQTLIATTTGYALNLIGTNGNTYEIGFNPPAVEYRDFIGLSLKAFINGSAEIPSDGLTVRLPTAISTDYYCSYSNIVRPTESSFDIDFYYYTNERNNVDKTYFLGAKTTMSGVLRNECDILYPSILIEYHGDLPNFNYCYIKKFNRWYFIDGFTVVTDKLCRLDMSVDVLQTYRIGILGLTAMVDRNEFEHNYYIPDDRLVYNTGSTISAQRIENKLFDDQNGQYVLSGMLVSVTPKT